MHNPTSKAIIQKVTEDIQNAPNSQIKNFGSTSHIIVNYILNFKYHKHLILQ